MGDEQKGADSQTELRELEAQARLRELHLRVAELREREAASEKRRLLDSQAASQLTRKQSWWTRARPTLSAAGVASLIAAMLPVATFIHSWFDKSSALALEREKQAETMRATYLDRLKDEESRSRVLRFIARTSQDRRMVGWAESELLLVEGSKKDLTAQIQALPSKPDRETLERLSLLEARLGRPAAPSRTPVPRKGPAAAGEGQSISASSSSDPPSNGSAVPSAQNQRVACDRASRRTLQELDPAAHASANAICRSLTVVDLTTLDAPVQWKDSSGIGITFDTGRKINASSIWCSCYLAK